MCQKIIDFHVHVFPDKLASRAVKQLAEKSGLHPYTDGTLSDTKEKMKKWGISKAVVLNIATAPRQQHTINNFACQLLEDEQIVPFGTIHPFAEDALEELDRICEMGIKGIKLHPEYQNFAVDDASVLAVYKKCMELGLIVLFHAGKDIAYPHTLQASPKAIRKVADLYPDLKIVAAHMGGNELWEDVYTYLSGSTVYMDTSLVATTLPVDLMKKILDRHGTDKILFGSDCPWLDAKTSKEYIQKLGLNPKEEDSIFYNNGAMLLSL